MKDFISIFKSIVVLMIFGIVLIIGGSVGAWDGPTSAPPMNNVAAPLNQGTLFGGGPVSDLANTNIIGLYGNLKIKISPCSNGQVLMWSTTSLSTGQVVCGNPTINVGLLDVLNVNSNASAYRGGIIFGTTSATWMNLSGEFRASWIHATSTVGFSSFAGKLLVGTGITPNADAQLHVYNTTGNAEIDIQSRSGSGNHWGIYHDAPSNELRFWKGADDKVTVSDLGIVKAFDFCIFGGKCLRDTTATIYKGFTTSSFTGANGGYTGANSKCRAVFSGSHVCTLNEVLDSINFGVTLPTGGDYWISAGVSQVTQSTNDCGGWTDASDTRYGVVWSPATTGGKSGLRQCSVAHKFLCCQ